MGDVDLFYRVRMVVEVYFWIGIGNDLGYGLWWNDRWVSGIVGEFVDWNCL